MDTLPIQEFHCDNYVQITEVHSLSKIVNVLCRLFRRPLAVVMAVGSFDLLTVSFSPEVSSFLLIMWIDVLLMFAI